MSESRVITKIDEGNPNRIALLKKNEEHDVPRALLYKQGLDALIWKNQFIGLCCSGMAPADAFNHLMAGEASHA